MRPMPKGVTTLEDLERHARASGQTPPPGFARTSLKTDAQHSVAEIARDGQEAAAAPTALAAMLAQASLPGSMAGATNAGNAQDAAAQDSGQTLLSLLSKAASAAAPAEQPAPTAITPPPGFPAISKPQAPISWGTSPQLQGIWGAPSPSSSGAPATWGAPMPTAAHSSVPTSQQAAFAQLLQGGAAEQLEARPSQQLPVASAPVMHAARVPSGGLPDQPGSAIQQRAGATAMLGMDRMASSGAAPAEADIRRDQAPSHASNPLLALLGQHRPSVASGVAFVAHCMLLPLTQLGDLHC